MLVDLWLSGEERPSFRSQALTAIAQYVFVRPDSNWTIRHASTAGIIYAHQWRDLIAQCRHETGSGRGEWIGPVRPYVEVLEWFAERILAFPDTRLSINVRDVAGCAYFTYDPAKHRERATVESAFGPHVAGVGKSVDLSPTGRVQKREPEMQFLRSCLLPDTVFAQGAGDCEDRVVAKMRNSYDRMNARPLPIGAILLAERFERNNELIDIYGRRCGGCYVRQPFDAKSEMRPIVIKNAGSDRRAMLLWHASLRSAGWSRFDHPVGTNERSYFCPKCALEIASYVQHMRTR